MKKLTMLTAGGLITLATLGVAGAAQAAPQAPAQAGPVAVIVMDGLCQWVGCDGPGYGE